MDFSDKLIVVTGAGSGIGRELALQLSETGALVVGVDYNAESLAASGQLVADVGGVMHQYAVDISDRTQVLAFASQLIQDHKRVDALINNAGIIQPHATIEQLPYEQLQRVFDVNWWGTYFMIHALLPHLRRQAAANIVNLSSMGGYMPFPAQVGYGASKAAIKLLSEGLRVELAKDSSISVSVVYPGAVSTNISNNSPGVARQLEHLREEHETKEFGVSAGQAATAIIRGMSKGQARILVGIDSWLIDKLYRLFPTLTARFMSWLIAHTAPDLTASNK